MQEEDVADAAGSTANVVSAAEELEEIGDPELEAMEERIIERPSAWKIGAGSFAVLVIACSAVFGWVMRQQTSTLPRLTDRQITELSDRLEEASALLPHRRRAAAGRALAQIEQDRIPGPLLRAMVDGGRQAEHTRLLGLRRALLDPEVRSLWQDLCPPDFDLDALAMKEASGSTVYRLCRLHRVELLTASHVITSHGSEVLAAHAIFVHLKDHEALTDVEIRALSDFARGTVRATRAAPFR